MESEKNTLSHISHLHPLKLTELHQEGPKPICHACRLPCTDLAFGCSSCGSFLHPTCARLPPTLRYPSHPSHPLTPRLFPAYSGGAFICSACGGGGTAFCFHYPDCEFDLHLPCAVLPEKLNNHPSHPSHVLTLTYEDPYNGEGGEGALCDLCQKFILSSQWIYLCRSCDFGGHVDCFTSKKPTEKSPTSGGSPQPLHADPTEAPLIQPQEEVQSSMAVHAGRGIANSNGQRKDVFLRQRRMTVLKNSIRAMAGPAMAAFLVVLLALVLVGGGRGSS